MIQMMCKIFYTLLTLITTLSVFSQKSITLTGNVTDNRSNAIPTASVYILNTNFGVSTDAKGNFTISNITLGYYTLQVSAVGYATINKEIDLRNNQRQALIIRLNPSSIQLDAVIVSAQKKKSLYKNTIKYIGHLLQTSAGIPAVGY